MPTNCSTKLLTETVLWNTLIAAYSQWKQTIGYDIGGECQTDRVDRCQCSLVLFSSEVTQDEAAVLNVISVCARLSCPSYVSGLISAFIRAKTITRRTRTTTSWTSTDQLRSKKRNPKISFVATRWEKYLNDRMKIISIDMQFVYIYAKYMGNPDTWPSVSLFGLLG